MENRTFKFSSVRVRRPDTPALKTGRPSVERSVPCSSSKMVGRAPPISYTTSRSFTWALPPGQELGQVKRQLAKCKANLRAQKKEVCNLAKLVKSLDEEVSIEEMDFFLTKCQMRLKLDDGQEIFIPCGKKRLYEQVQSQLKVSVIED